MIASRSIDLNADVGEGCGQDTALMPLISSANIACGFHAGDEQSMHAAVSLALQHRVVIGAHPSFPDREHFGRREMHLGADRLHECIVAQLRALADVASRSGARLHHVKPHGALYNLSARDEQVAEAIAMAVTSVDPRLLLVGLAGSASIRAAERAGLRAVNEVFADRAYRSDGSLLPRDQEGSVLHDETVVAARAVGMARDHAVTAVDGGSVSVSPDSICVHGDTPGAAALAKRIREALGVAGISVMPPPLRT